MSEAATQTRPGKSAHGWSAPLILVIGVLVAPWSLSLLFNSWDTPDAAAFVRMAFASVAGCVVAVITVLGLFIDRIVRRASRSAIATFGAIAVVCTVLQVQGIASAADLLLQRLGTLP